MITVPTLPESAPFTLEQRAWLNGYLAGLFSRGQMDPVVASAAPASAPSAALKPLTILFGSQTGTAEGLARRAAKDAGKRGFVASIMDMAGFTAAQLAQEKNVLLITSTYGDGEPPDNAKALHMSLVSGDTANAPRFSNLRFSVCGLGDTNYVKFNQCAKDFDLALEKFGGTRIAPRVDCDLEFEEHFAGWLNAALAAFGASESEVGAASCRDGASESRDKPAPTLGEADLGYSRKNPFAALLLTSRNLNASGSGKQVHHVEFDLSGSGLAYEAGDALGVYAHNCPELVQEVLTAVGCDGEEAVSAPDGSTASLRRALTELYDLAKPTAELLALAPIAAAAGGLADSSPPAYIHVIDVLLAVSGAKPAPAELIKMLKKLQPRLYSISSSPKTHSGQVHLTVGAVRYEQAGRPRKGVCSTFLSDRAQPGTSRVGVYIHSNKSFRPPANPDAPMIMVGPGTGVAPFRAFLHDRRSSGAKGKNWLFFGDQRASTDFLYQPELMDLLREGALTRLDTAFSRDQNEKIYVQHRMLENATELYAWLEAGGHFYVCGDANRMAKDVDAALHRVIEIAGARTTGQAADYVNSLKAAKRYARDVY